LFYANDRNVSILLDFPIPCCVLVTGIY